MKFVEVLRVGLIHFFEGWKKSLLWVISVVFVLFIIPPSVQGQIIESEVPDGSKWVRSLETLRDLNYESWQVVAYSNIEDSSKVILRIVGFPGRVRLDHPTDLQVCSGRRHWTLADRTLLNPQLATDKRQAAAEFDMSPLVSDLVNNRPLRLELKGVFTELPVPPYLVAEWRSLVQPSSALR